MMQFFNKNLKFILPLVLIVLILYGYLKLKSYDFGKADPVLALTDKNIFFIETSYFPALINELSENNDMWDELRQVPGISIIDTTLKNLRSLPVKEEDIKLLFTGKIILALNKDPENKFSLVFISSQITRRQNKTAVSSLLKIKEVENISRRKFEGSYVYEVKMTNNSGIDPCFFTFKKGLFILSFSSKQVEETLSSLNKTQDVSPIKHYNRIKSTVAENVKANIFFNLSSIDEFINGFSLHSPIKTKLFASSGGFDLEINKTNLSLNGFIALDDSLNEGIKIIANQVPAVMRLPDCIPASADFFMLLSFNNPSAFFDNQSEYGIWKPSPQKLDEIKNKYSIALQDFFQKNTTGEFGLILTNYNNKPSFFFIAEVISGSIAENQLKTWSGKFASANRQNIKDFHYYRKVDSQSGINTYRIPFAGIPKLVFGNVFKNITGDFFTVFNNCLIVGNSAEETAEFAYQLILGRNITSAEKYKNILENMLSRTNFFVYMNPCASAGKFTSEMSSQTLNCYSKYHEIFKKFNAFTFQSNSSDDLYYSRIFLNFSEDFNEHVNTVWQSKLDTVIIMKPAIVTNHTNGGKEIIVQDAKNQLYLISNAGRILWKIPLDEPVLSEIYQVDYYRNRRLQYLFNTRTKIYLIDRNGNPVEKYPLILRSPASNGLALFDYENNGNIRICIACENKKIYLYDKEGKIVPGWNPAVTDHLVQKTLQHYRIGQKDYIIASDNFKTYIFDRRGQIRINPPKHYPVSQNNYFYPDMSHGKEKARFVSTDTMGNILYIYPSGNILTETRNPVSNRHFFVLSDLNGDNSYEYIILHDNDITVTNETGNIIFHEHFESGIHHRPVIFEFSKNDKKIGIVLEEKEKIYLFNSDGTLYNGFPLKGSSLFSISSFPDLKGRFNLIVGNKDNFLYNYSVQ